MIRSILLVVSVTGRFKTSHSWALQNQPVNAGLDGFRRLLFFFGSGPGGRFGWFRILGRRGRWPEMPRDRLPIDAQLLSDLSQRPALSV